MKPSKSAMELVRKHAMNNGPTVEPFRFRHQHMLFCNVNPAKPIGAEGCICLHALHRSVDWRSPLDQI